MSAAETREPAFFCKPCPFCGGSPEYERVGTARQSMIIACQDCGAKVESNDVAGLMAVEEYRWNRHVPLPDDKRMVERAARALAAYQFSREDYWEDQVDMALFVIRAINGGKP